MESPRHNNTQPNTTNSLEQGLYDGLNNSAVDGNSTDTLNGPKQLEDTDVLSSGVHASDENPITPESSQEIYPTPPETPPTPPSTSP